MMQPEAVQYTAAKFSYPIGDGGPVCLLQRLRGVGCIRVCPFSTIHTSVFRIAVFYENCIQIL